MVLHSLILLQASSFLVLLTVVLAHSKNGTSSSVDFDQRKALQPIEVHNEAINSGRAVSNAYYDFIINEGSYKFWAVFQLTTVAILLYSVFAAIYFAKYMYLTDPPTSDNDDLFARANFGQPGAMDYSTFFMIIEALDSLPPIR